MPSAALIAEPAESILSPTTLDVLLVTVSRRDTIAQLKRYSAFRPTDAPWRRHWPLVRAMRLASRSREELIIDRADGRRAIVRARAEPIVSTPGNAPSSAVMTL